MKIISSHLCTHLIFYLSIYIFVYLSADQRNICYYIHLMEVVVIWLMRLFFFPVSLELFNIMIMYHFHKNNKAFLVWKFYKRPPKWVTQSPLIESLWQQECQPITCVLAVTPRQAEEQESFRVKRRLQVCSAWGPLAFRRWRWAT